MDKILLEATTRKTGERAKDLIREDFLPLEFYGRGIDNVSLKVPYQMFRKAFKDAGYNTILEIRVDDKDSIKALVHDVQIDPVSDRYIHVDIVNVRMDEKIHAKVPLEFVGTAPVVKDEGGIVVTHMTEIEISCLPGNLIHNVEVNVESLIDFNASVKVEDLNVPDNVEILHEPDEVVVNAVPPRVEEEPEEIEDLGIELGGEAAEGAEVEAGDEEGGEDSE